MDQAILRGQKMELDADIAVAKARMVYWEQAAKQESARVDYIVRRYQSEMALRQTEIELYNNQRFMEWPIFGLVVLIVFAALVLAYMQLASWLVSKENLSEKSTALSINKNGIELNTPFVGLLMLVGAFAFFYMYVDQVYSIQTRAEKIAAQILKSGGNSAAASGAPVAGAVNNPARAASQPAK
jgi:ABC-type multidrug transport system fused ATPase/permease subunit